MRLLILSDLHRELWREYAPRIDPLVSRPDIVILAGDIDTGARAVDWAVKTFVDVPVLYVHGNHEAYGRNLEDVREAIGKASTAFPTIHFLNCSEVIFSQTRFLGATLWTDFRLFGDETRQAAMREAEATMTDYKRIRLAQKSYRKLRASDTAQRHALEKSWLKGKLAQPYSGKTVVITHMAPSLRSISGQYATDLVSAAYASNLEKLAEQSDLWVHGHVHDSFDYQIGKCRVVSNPCGYMNRSGGTENKLFDPNLIIEI